jgi:hypothetical protein
VAASIKSKNKCKRPSSPSKRGLRLDILEPGDHRAELKENFRRNVSWKDVVVRLAERLRMDGEAYCAKVLASTKPSRTVSLVIE